MKRGCLYTALSAMLFGALPLLTRMVLAKGATPLTVAFYRVLFVTLFLFVLLKSKRIPLRLERWAWAPLVSISVFGSGLTMILLNESYAHVDTGIATSLHFLYPLFVSLLCCVRYQEQLHPRQWLALAAAFCGTLCFMSKGEGDGLGYGLAIASACTYAFYPVKMDKSGLVHIHAYLLSFYLALFAALEMLALHVFTANIVFCLDGVSYALLAVIALSASFLATVLLQKGVALLGSTQASIICLLEPITAMVLGALFLNEAISGAKLAGTGCIVAALLLFLKRENKQGGQIDEP